MLNNAIVDLRALQRDRKLKEADLFRRILDERLPLYFRVPEDKTAFFAAKEYLDLLREDPSEAELRRYALMGGVQEVEHAQDVAWLRVPDTEYETLLASGICQVPYFFQGLQPSGEGMKPVVPQFKMAETGDKFRLFPRRRLLPGSVVYFVGQTRNLTTAPPAYRVALDQIQVFIDDFKTKSDDNVAKRLLPPYKYASSILEIALEVWKQVWYKDFETLNNKQKTEKEQLPQKHKEAKEKARAMLDEHIKTHQLNEKYPDLHNQIAARIRPEHFVPENADHWFTGPVSNDIVAMIKASDEFWAPLPDDEKTYGPDLTREMVIAFLMEKHGLKEEAAKIATKIIQPDGIKRGARKASR